MNKFLNLILFIVLIGVQSTSFAQAWDIDHSRSIICFSGGGSAPASEPYTMDANDQLKMWVGIDVPQLGVMCGVNFFNDKMCMDVDNSQCLNPSGVATVSPTVINSDTFMITISATGAGTPWLNKDPEIDFTCGIMGWAPLSNKQISITGTFPIELTSQNVIQLKNSQNLLYSFIVATQLNNDWFDVELLYDDESEWKNVGEIKGAGTTVNTMEYSLTIPNVSSGYNYVRLKQTDYDGTFTYGPALAIEVDQLVDATIWNVANTPTDSKIYGTNLWNAQHKSYDVLVYDLFGSIVAHQSNVSLDQFTYGFAIETGDLPVGLYTILLGGEGKNHKVIGKASIR